MVLEMIANHSRVTAFGVRFPALPPLTNNIRASDGNWHTYWIQTSVFLGSTPRMSTKI